MNPVPTPPTGGPGAPAPEAETQVVPAAGPVGVAVGHLVGGRYRLTRHLAAGGMARVWEATDEVLRRQVAVKILHPHLGADEAFVRRFRQEAVAAARLAHPGIVSIFDTCSEPGVEAIVMELLPGRTLRDRLDEPQPVDPWQAAGLAAQVADALAAAHRAGLVHRDIKPANILLGEGGRVKVADFGIAKAVADADLTQPGAMVGTAKYLAPEQVTGGTVDARTDIYSLGAVLYEMLCGRPPFAGDSDPAVALARLHRDPLLPRQVRPGVPRALEAVTMRAMARQPGERYPSATDLRAALLACGADAEPDPTDGATVLGVFPVADPTGVAPGTGAATAPTFAQSERSWLVPTVLVVTVAVALGIAGLLLGRSGAGTFIDDVRQSLGAGSADEAAVTVASATAFDPDGDRRENDGQAALAVDGDPSTAWTTEGYDDRDVTRLKAGVGLVLRLDAARRLDRLVLRSPTANWRARVYVADRPATTLEGWGEPAFSSQDVPRSDDQPVSFDLGGRQGAAVLVWIVDAGEPGDDGRHRVTLSEVELDAR